MAKNQFIRARVAGWEKDCIRLTADAAHMTESEFVRRAAMNREVTVIEGMDAVSYTHLICGSIAPTQMQIDISTVRKIFQNLIKIHPEA